MYREAGLCEACIVRQGVGGRDNILLARTRPEGEQSQCLPRLASAAQRPSYDDAKPSPERFADVVQGLAAAALPAAPAAAAMPDMLAAVAHPPLAHFGSHP